MKKKMFTFILATLLASQSMCGFFLHAQNTEIPENVEEMTFNTEYWLESSEEAWYKFTAPTPQCSFTDMPIQDIEGIYYGSPVRNHICYDKDGKSRGMISGNNDPATLGWTEFNVGETYYIHVTAPNNNGVFFTLSGVKEIEPTATPDKRSTTTKTEISLAAKNIKKFIDGESNSYWDVYTIREEFSCAAENSLCASSFFILPYTVYFDSAKVTTDSGKATYSIVEKAYSTSWDTLKSYTDKPYSKTEMLNKGEYVFSANQYSYIMDTDSESLSGTREYCIYVPTGKRLVQGDDGCFYAAKATDLFTDIAANSWYTDSVQWCAENSYMVGTANNVFSPKALLTRAQIIKILANIADPDLTPYSNKQSFSDVPKGTWFSEAVEWAYDMGITKGSGNGKFSPNAEVSRQEIAVFLCSYAAFAGIDLTASADLSIYTDISDIAPWASDAMMQAVALGLIKGTSETTLSPTAKATRAEISVMIKRFYDNLLEPTLPSLRNGSYMLIGGTCGNAVYEEIVKLTGKENPHVLYIGMASTDPQNGYSAVEVDFGISNECTTDVLTLADLESDVAAQKIAAADIVYVGGGDSRMLLARLKKHGTDELLRDAALNGTVMCGSSAGAICFGAYGTSGIGDNRFYNLSAVGCVDMVVCPHGAEEKRVQEMKNFILDNPSFVGVAVDFSGLEIHNGQFRIYTSQSYKEKAIALKCWVEGAELKTQELTLMEWYPLSELFND